MQQTEYYLGFHLQVLKYKVEQSSKCSYLTVNLEKIYFKKKFRKNLFNLAYKICCNTITIVLKYYEHIWNKGSLEMHFLEVILS